MSSEPVEVTVNNHMNTSSLPPLDTQSLSSNEDATERTPTPRVHRRSHKDADSRVEEVGSDDEGSENDETGSEEGSEEGSDYNSSDYETDSDGSKTSFVDATTNPMYLILSSFLETPDLENRINVTEAILQLKTSVDRVADMLEKLVTNSSSTVL